MKKLLVVGDIILDKYTHVVSNRKAQEADIPVYDPVNNGEIYIPGGAANVAFNAAALSIDEFTVELSGITENNISLQIMNSNLVSWAEFVFGDVIEKHRLVMNNKVVARIDNKKKFADEKIKEFEDLFLTSNLSQYSMIIVSDYDKGTVTDKILNYIKSSGVKTVVDSKRYDLTPYKGYYILNVNELEYGLQVSNRNYTTVESLFDFVLVTRGANGAELRQYEKFRSDNFMYTVHTENFPVKSVPVVDVTGCGDTFTAALTVGLLRDQEDIRSATKYANMCASLAVQRFSTARITKWDFLKSLEQS